MTKDLKKEMAWLDRALQAEAGKRGLVPKKSLLSRICSWFARMVGKVEE